jgi:hypothetical protein
MQCLALSLQNNSLKAMEKKKKSNNYWSEYVFINIEDVALEKSLSLTVSETVIMA